MLIKDISFIEVKSPGAHIFSKFPIPRLGSVLLSTILANKGFKVKVFIEDVAEPDWLFIESSDLVCISTITSTAVRAYALADRLRKRGIPVVMGGAHPSLMPGEALGHADYVVRGEGDYTLPELIEYLTRGTPPVNSIEGVSYRGTSAGTVHNPPRPLLENMDALPGPDFSLIHGWKPSNTYPISTSRGCPFSCRFCSVIHLFGRKYRFRSVNVTLAEIRRVIAEYKATIFFVDDNFTANKKRAKAILKGMVDEGIKHSWSAQVRTDIAGDPELLRLMADSGCNTLYIGFESINPVTLALYEKKQSIGEIIKCIKVVKEHRINIHGMFVLGADTDTIDTIRHTADFAVNLGLDTVQFMPLTPLPGTPVFAEMKEAGRLLHTDWSKYDMHHVVFNPAAMGPDTLQIETLKAMKKFYSWRYILNHLARFDFHYAMIGLYGNRTVKQLLGKTKEYFEAIGSAPCKPLNV
ncbi:MAG: B12-binding domain-containing radical SAM protein [Nitrospirae bacterium]|nr:B12-binding domain-containing radical SAM protein [Nitrospirota bacterium]MCL5237707.1 B12-binding domain-containing radical SAM protein [Nitrospirota bacterium]